MNSIRTLVVVQAAVLIEIYIPKLHFAVQVGHWMKNVDAWLQ